MPDNLKSRIELYLAYAAGNHEIELPEPQTRVEHLLVALIEEIESIGSGASYEPTPATTETLGCVKSDAANGMFTVDENGNVTIDAYAKGVIDTLLAARIAVNQGSGNAGKLMIVGSNGDVAPAASPSYTKAETDALLGLISALIPAQATSNNQLADKKYVDYAVATGSATFIGNFASLAALEAYSGDKDNNDIAWVITTETVDGAQVKKFNRYKYNGSTSTWALEYTIDSPSFLPSELAAIQSGITAQLVALISSAVQPGALATVATSGSYNDLSNKPTIPDELADLSDDSTHRVVTDAEKATWNGKYAKPSGGIPASVLAGDIPASDLAAAVQTSLGKADTAYQLPSSGIPAADLAAVVQTSLGMAGTAVQPQMNAGFHNSIYRGKYLGSSVSSTQWAAIEAGTFDDMYVGDYWTIDSNDYIIACFNYYYGTGNPANITPHIVILPRNNLYNAKMNSTDANTSGYSGSQMRTTNLASAKTTIQNAFGSSHIMQYTGYLVSATTNGRPSTMSATLCDIELLDEYHMYGTLHAGALYVTTASEVTYERSQFPLFHLNPSLMASDSAYWLRNPTYSGGFACSANPGGVTAGAASSKSYGVRPYFCICQASS